MSVLRNVIDSVGLLRKCLWCRQWPFTNEYVYVFCVENARTWMLAIVSWLGHMGVVKYTRHMRSDTLSWVITECVLPTSI
ncbi:hypothetical protein EG68_03906 [Paragonimus skrjabini miyazakii]|uniref:Uncharacterized protein n=1 Tax=Paragonimus skrjabini miyazakii TaxID=59628 RepID=A0A8S9Z203_9TREM|nr:hypothetical protein EG68_03906 [Paragonimus skrjabini miyazakii]